MVLFPLPDGPTIAVHVPGLMVRLMFLRILFLGRTGYAKERLLKTTGKGVGIRFVPAVSWDEIRGS